MHVRIMGTSSVYSAVRRVVTSPLLLPPLRVWLKYQLYQLHVDSDNFSFPYALALRVGEYLRAYG